ncbi:proteoglycan 4 isoform X5 [Lagenorhynchus albirostris]|uniref:proteoglycan 4 isoform X5 n=1 Tax=Lagenorhynchus albirostris TaxID=27610 RepID=UPI0028EB0759|nr:proteoglycan 4 isoform X5 [Lagenorhynchus albirostris]
MERKILPIYFLLLLSVFLIQQVSSQDLSSCAGRCGEGYSRDAICNCDYNCQHYMECCPDFKKVCAVEFSCKGRCFESFSRGRACDCDSECKKYGKCCSDYDSFCEKAKENKKKRTPKMKPTPEPPVIDEAGSGPDNGDFKLTPTPNIPTTQRNKFTTTPKITIVKPILSKPSIPPNSDTTKETPLTANKETTDETKETSTTNKQTSTTAKEKTTSAKETQNAEKTSTKDFAPTSEVPATSTLKAETISKSPALTSPKEPDPTTKESTPTTTKEPAPTTKESTPTTTKEPAPTTKASTPTTTKKPASTTKASTPTTTKEPAPTTKESTPTTTKEPAPTTPREPAPTTKESTLITTKEPAPTTTKEQAPTTPKELAPTTKESTPITTKEPAPTTTKVPAPTTTKEQAPTTKESTPITTKEPAPTTTKVPAPTTPKEPASATPKEPTPSSPNTPAPTTSEASTSTITMEPPTTPKGPAESTPEFPVEPTPKTLENSPKEPAVPTTKAPKVTKPEMTTTAKDKATEQDTTDTMASSKITLKATTLAPKVMTATKKTTEETTSKPEPTTAIPKGTATNAEVTTPKPQKPTKAPKKLTCTKKTKTPKVRKPKTTPTPPKMTSAMPKSNPTSLAEAKLQTTTSPNQTPNSEIIEVNPKNEDADATEGEKPQMMIPRPPVLTPIVIPGTDFIGRGPSQGIGINPVFSDETNLCNGKPVDGLTTLRNGTLVAFRGHYFWMLNAFSPPSPPRRITEVWGIPSPIDTVFTRCNCEGKTFFFKDSQYWRFTNDIKDAGYPKLISKGFGGLNGKIVAALTIAKYKNRPESVYFFKRGGSIQQYTYKQEPTQKCTRRKLAISYPVYGETTQIRRRRFERAIEPSQTHTIRIHYSPIRVTYQDKGFLHNEVKVSTLWRGLPNVVTSAISLPNIRKPDGYDYYAFSKDQYYNIDVPTRTARGITTRSGQTLSNVWYNCP